MARFPRFAPPPLARAAGRAPPPPLPFHAAPSGGPAGAAQPRTAARGGLPAGRLQPPPPGGRVIQRLSSKQRDDAEAVLGDYWKTMRTAGAHNAALAAFAGAGGVHACGARINLGANGMLPAQTLNASYSGACHAEMEALQMAFTLGYAVGSVLGIEIEKEPCPRCAVILHRTGVAGAVSYKNAGQKDNRGWQFPAYVAANKDFYLQITAQIAANTNRIFGSPTVNPGDITYLASRFADQNWWS